MAIFNGTIRVRRGLESDFDESKMVSGELAIATDKPVIWFCWKDGTAAKIEGTVTSETLKKYFDEWNGDSNILIDETLSKTGQAADAKVTGDKFNELASDIENIGNPTDEQISNAVNSYMDNNPITITETDPTVPEWAKQPQKPTYTASEVGAEASGTADGKVSSHNTAGDAHNDIRELISGLTQRLNALADSDDTTLDQMSEVVAYIKSNKSLIDAITTSKVSVSDIIDNLATNVSNKPLSAAQGVALKALIDGIVIPEKLPNPQKLTFAGAVTAEYDGSGAVTVTIPEGSGGTGGTVRIEKGSTDTSVELEPNKLYVFPEIGELTLTFAEPSDTGIANEYHVVFQSGETATTLSLPDTIKIPSGFTVEANKIYEISIMEGCLCAQNWEVTA